MQVEVGGRVLFFFCPRVLLIQRPSQLWANNYGRTPVEGLYLWTRYFSISRSITELTISDRESSCCCLTESYGSKEVVPHPHPQLKSDISDRWCEVT